MKKGFTLVELLAVIVILGVLVTLAVPSVIFISNKIKTNMYCSKIEMIEKAAQLYGQDNENLFDETITCLIGSVDYPCLKNGGNDLKVGDLVSNGYITADENDAVVDPRDKESMNDTPIYVYKKYNRVYSKVDTDMENGTSICE